MNIRARIKALEKEKKCRVPEEGDADIYGIFPELRCLNDDELMEVAQGVSEERYAQIVETARIRGSKCTYP